LESRRVLGRSIGLDARAAMRIFELSDSFPEYDGRPVSIVDRTDELVMRALEMRRDIAALRTQHQAVLVRLDAARLAKRAKLDVVLSATQLALAEGASPNSVGSTLSSNFGPGYSAMLVFQMPFGNNTAAGLVLQQEAVSTALQIRTQELGYAIVGSVQTAAHAVLRATEQLQEADAAVGAYAVSLENERTKRRLGTATLIDVLAIEERYNNALLGAVQARERYAIAIARFRFELGSLVSRHGDLYRARVTDLLTHATQ
jgi:outer membrane protein TolC